jgi:hypothetical protein
MNPEIVREINTPVEFKVVEGDRRENTASYKSIDPL